MEPCGLRAAAMFNDVFTLINYTVAPGMPADSAPPPEVRLEESGIAWSTDDAIFRNSEDVADGIFRSNVEYLHQQQPHIVSPDEGVENEHFRVWMHSEVGGRYISLRGLFSCLFCD